MIAAIVSRAYWRSRTRYLVKCAVLLAAIIAGGATFERYCYIGRDPQDVLSTGYRWFFVMRRHAASAAGEYVAFKVDARALPYFKPGEIFVKRIACMFPCHVEESETSLSLNGEPEPPINPLVVAKLGRSVKDFQSSRDLRPGEMFVLGSNPRSFDSRYWGELTQDQVVGLAHPIF